MNMRMATRGARTYFERCGERDHVCIASVTFTKATVLKSLLGSRIRARPTETVRAQAQFSHNGGGPLVNQYPKPTECAIAYGQESLMVNAAVMTGKNSPDNAPWLVDVELPRAT